MKTYMFLPLAVFAVILSNCAPITDLQQPKKVDPAQSKAIERAKPPHSGSGQTGSYGLYDYTVYRYSVKIRATSGAVRINHVDVFDMNRDGSFDSIFAFQDGAWRFASRLGPEYRLIPNSTSSDVLRDYLSLAYHARRDIQERNARAAEQKRRDEAEAYRRYQEGIRNGTIQPNYYNSQ